MLEGETFLVCVFFWHVQKVLLTQHYYVFWFWDSFTWDLGPKIQIPSEDKCRSFVWPPTDRQTLKFWKQSEKYKRYLQRLWAQDYVNGSVSPMTKGKKQEKMHFLCVCPPRWNLAAYAFLIHMHLDNAFCFALTNNKIAFFEISKAPLNVKIWKCLWKIEHGG